jgi:hypothetical protein
MVHAAADTGMAAAIGLARLSADAVLSSTAAAHGCDPHGVFCVQDGFVKNVADVVKMGDVLKVKVLSVDVEGKRLALSRKGLAPRPAANQREAEAAEEGESKQWEMCKDSY